MKCNICEFKCDIAEDKRGVCNMYENKGGQIKERFKNSFLFVNPISIETQPMLHFFPNHKFLQLGSVGCNFKCNGCVSNIFVKYIDIFKDAFKTLTADEVLKIAHENHCKGISFGINEPTMHYYSLLELAKKAKEDKLLFGISTNLYYTKEALFEFIKYVDFVNVGLKGYFQDTYRKFCKAPDSKPVFRNIVYLFKNNVYIEISIPYAKGSEDEIIKTAAFISRLSRQIPFQVMRFIPFDNASDELEPSIKESEELIETLKQYLDNVYLFNSPGTKYLDTTTKDFSIKRCFYGPMGAHVISAQGTPHSIMGTLGTKNFTEDGFFGGYRLTRALEMVIGILNALGIKDTKAIAFVIGTILKDKTFLNFFHETQDDQNTTLENYLNVINLLAAIAHTDPSKLISYYNKVLELVKQKRKFITKKLKSYYVMGTPIFALNTHRFENKLASFIGLDTIKLEKEGKPGINISHETLLAYNPDIIFISGFLSCAEEDFYAYCKKNGLTIKAIEHKKVFRLPFGWDFGTTNWIFGLMFIANKAYPDIYKFDIKEEYFKFHGQDNVLNSKTFYEEIN